MSRDRLIQLIALLALIAGAVVSGNVLPAINETTERHVLRYTDEPVEGAPPAVALGTAIGALRGLIVDYLWIKVHFMKQEGLYYEIMADADLITKLQPRFAAVWAFHGHNMAYNISVAHNTEAERWEWVKAGIDLVRNEGLRYNPGNLQLHKELSFWFLHKIEGVADDAHLYYKREFAREWHNLLGRPPVEYEARIEWIKAVADAPETLDEAERRTPGVKALVERLRRELEPYEDRFDFELDSRFLRYYAEWRALSGESRYAQLFDVEDRTRRDNPAYVVFDEIASDPELEAQWRTLLRFVRRKVLIEDYNMDPARMYRYTRDYGPIDWRSAFAHSLYWSLKGSEQGEERVAVSEEDVYRIVNNDRMTLQSMQGLARWGRINFDPFSTDWVSRLPAPRWIAAIDDYWESYSVKHRDTRGPGPDMFMAFHQNFLKSAVRELYRSGEHELAQRYLDRLNQLYGPASRSPRANPLYANDLETFVWSTIKEEYEYQPHLAPSDVAAALRYGIRVGLGRNRPEIFENAIDFARQVTEYFKYNEYNNFVTKMGSSRLGDLIGALEDSIVTVFGETMADPTIPLDERLRIWLRAPDQLKVRVYDEVFPILRAQLESHPVGRLIPAEQALPAPPGLEEYRRRRAQQQQQETREGPAPAEVERR